MCANYESDFEEFDEDSMPCPCEKCGSWFDQPNGYGSELWFPNTIICPRCHEEEQIELVRRDWITEALRNIDNREAIRYNKKILKENNYIKGEEEEW